MKKTTQTGYKKIVRGAKKKHIYNNSELRI